MIDEKVKNQIDLMSYEEMLRKWRFSPTGHFMFIGETGEYFSKTMNEKKEKLSNEEQVRISKEIGW